MKNFIEIKKIDIRKKVMSEISKAKKEILATMLISEEISAPLPVEYFELLRMKMKEGVKVKRIVFGTEKQYKYFLKQMKKQSIFFSGKHTKSKNYKRMIMIDKTKLFFRKNGKFYFTKHYKYIKEFKGYFNKFT